MNDRITGYQQKNLSVLVKKQKNTMGREVSFCCSVLDTIMSKRIEDLAKSLLMRLEKEEEEEATTLCIS